MRLDIAEVLQNSVDVIIGRIGVFVGRVWHVLRG